MLPRIVQPDVTVNFVVKCFKVLISYCSTKKSVKKDLRHLKKSINVTILEKESVLKELPVDLNIKQSETEHPPVEMESIADS